MKTKTKKWWKIIIRIILIIVLVLIVLSIPIIRRPPAILLPTISSTPLNCFINYTWDIGKEETVKATLKYDNNICIIAIEGNGEMADLIDDERNPIAWHGQLKDMSVGWMFTLEQVNISEGVTSVGDFAFSNCYKLNYVYLPSSIKKIGFYSFVGCDELSYIKFNGTTQQWNNIQLEDEWNYRSHIEYIECNDGIVQLS